MNTPIQAASQAVTEAANQAKGTLADDVRHLLTVTTDTAGEQIAAARKRLTAALDAGAKIVDQVEAKAAEGAKYTEKAVQDHPYQALAIAFGIGALIGHAATHR